VACTSARSVPEATDSYIGVSVELGAQAVDTDAVLAVIDGGCLAEPDETVLARHIRRHTGERV
jgi:hypothetical protein